MLYLWQESSSKPQDDFKVSVEDYDVDLDEPTRQSTVVPSDKPTDQPTVEPTDKPSKTPEGQNEPTNKPTTKPTDKEISPTMKGALFIGDSRTVGLMEYSGIKDATFFSNVGMSVYNIYKNDANVSGVGEISLTKLLDTYDYDKVYLMLGINEVGYKTEPTIKKYGEVISFIQEKEPGAVIFIQANIHVSKERSDKDTVVNNNALNNFNENIKALANNKNIFYLDVNPLFDDEEGNLSEGTSGDGVHLYAKYYVQWGQWLERQTSRIVEKYF